MRGTSFMSGIRTQHATGGTTMHISKNCAIVIWNAAKKTANTDADSPTAAFIAPTALTAAH
jgi:hypothetical protein